MKPKRGFIESVRDISRNPEPERVGQRWGFGAFILVEAVFILSAVFITAVGKSLGAAGTRVPAPRSGSVFALGHGEGKYGDGGPAAESAFGVHSLHCFLET